MLSHYLKIAFRNLRKHWIQSLTGILGIAFAIACLVPSIYWVDYETSYDSFYPESETIYRVYTFEKQSGKENKGASKIIETKLRDQFPSIEASTSLMPAQETCRTDELPHIQLKLIYADNSFFQVFPQTQLSPGKPKSLCRCLIIWYCRNRWLSVSSERRKRLSGSQFGTPYGATCRRISLPP